MSNAVAAQQSVVNLEKPAKISFGNGRYSAVMEEVFKDTQRIFNLSVECAEFVARQFGSDFGAAMASQPVSVKYGRKVSDDGKITLAESCKAKGITMTNSISIARACDWINQVKSFGIDSGLTEWRLIPVLEKWVKEIQDKIDRDNKANA